MSFQTLAFFFTRIIFFCLSYHLAGHLKGQVVTNYNLKCRVIIKYNQILADLVEDNEVLFREIFFFSNYSLIFRIVTGGTPGLTQQGIGMVRDGSPCAIGGLCVRGRCTPIMAIAPVTCPLGENNRPCSGNGVSLLSDHYLKFSG